MHASHDEAAGRIGPTIVHPDANARTLERHEWFRLPRGPVEPDDLVLGRHQQLLWLTGESERARPAGRRLLTVDS